MTQSMTRKIFIAVAVILAASCGNRSPKTSEEIEKVQGEIDSLTAVTTPSADTSALQEALPPEAVQEPVFDIVTNMGTIKVKLYKNTPRHRDNFRKLAESGYYDGTLFHRVIKGFMIQGGDPYTKDSTKVALYGQGGPDYTIPAEIRPENKHKKGALAAARRGDAANPFRESSGSQFYLVQSEEGCRHLDGQYTVFGETVAGLAVIDKIASSQVNNANLPDRPVKIISIREDKEFYKNQKN